MGSEARERKNMLKEYKTLADLLVGEVHLSPAKAKEQAQAITAAIKSKSPKAVAAVLFVNRLFGGWKVVAAGPGLILHKPKAAEGQHLNGLPRQRQYPVGWARL